MSFQIDKRTASEWMRYLNSATEQFAKEITSGQSVDVAVFTGRLSLNFLRALSDLADDETTRTHIAEHAAHGMSHAVVQHLLFTKPPSFSPPTETVN
jgi:hypothetical protein